jgi:hypothetical protein
MIRYKHKKLNLIAKKADGEENYTLLGPTIDNKQTILKDLVEKSDDWELLKEVCHRCGTDVDSQKRKVGYIGNSGEIRMEAAAQAFGYLQGAKHAAGHNHFKNWNNHDNSSIVKEDAQEIEIKWGCNNKDYTLCLDCQNELLRIIGAFFGYGVQKPTDLYSDNYNYTE